MRVHLVKEKAVNDFVAKHAAGRSSFESFVEVLKAADWLTPEDVKATFPATDVLGRGCKRFVFDIGGNNYRMICGYRFGKTKVHLFICWIGTHSKYTQLCKRGEQYTVDMFK